MESDKTSLSLGDLKNENDNTINGDKQIFQQSHILNRKVLMKVGREVQIQGMRHAV